WKWRDALLVPEEVIRIHLRLHRSKPLKIRLEVLLPPHSRFLIASRAVLVATAVHAEIQVPVVGVRAPGVLAHVRLHERVQVPDPSHMPLRRLRPILKPKPVVLEVEELLPVRERRRRRCDAAHPAAVGVKDEQPRAVLEEPAPRALPDVARDRCAHVVRLGLEEPLRLGAPVQEQLHRLPRDVEREVEDRLDPRHLDAVFRRNAELRERCKEAAAFAEVQGLELSVLVLQDDAEEHVAGKRGRHLLPIGEESGGGLVSRAVDGEYRDGGRHADETQLPGQNDAEAPAASAADGPEEVLPHGCPVQEPPLGVHYDGVDYMVRGEAVLPQQRPEPAAAEVAADADRRAEAAGEPEALAPVGDGVVQLAERRAGAHPRRLALHVDADGSERRQVDDGEGARRAEGAVRQALVVVAAAARAHADAVARAAAHGGLDVRRVGRRDDGEGRRGGGRDEQEVLDGGLEDGRVRLGRVRVDDSRREVDGEALEEARGIGRRSGRFCGLRRGSRVVQDGSESNEQCKCKTPGRGHLLVWFNVDG
ncbi:hypothetical protein EJB05_53261, partial [Eragrostis curvula]